MDSARRSIQSSTSGPSAVDELSSRLAATRAANAGIVSVGDLCSINWGGKRLEAIVDAASDRGLRVQVDGPNEKHELIGASIWVEPDTVKPLQLAKEGAVPSSMRIGASVRAVTLSGNIDEALVLDHRQGLKRGEDGVRFKLFFRDGERVWVRRRDVLGPIVEEAEAEALAEQNHAAKATQSRTDVDDVCQEPEHEHSTASLAAAISDAEVDDACMSDICSNDNEDNAVNCGPQPESTSSAVRATRVHTTCSANETSDSVASSSSADPQLRDHSSDLASSAPEPPQSDRARGAICSDDDTEPELEVSTLRAVGTDRGDRERQQLDPHSFAVPVDADDAEVMDANDDDKEALEAVDCVSSEKGEESGRDCDHVNDDGDDEINNDDDLGHAVQHTSSFIDEKLAIHEAVLVKWGGKQYNGVIIKREPRRARPVQVQFDADRTSAWLASGAVKPMPVADPASLPAWAQVGCAVEAVDPFDDSAVWYAGVLEEALRGVSDKHDDGVRLWVRYTESGMCQWLRRSHIRPGEGATTGPVYAGDRDVEETNGEEVGETHNSDAMLSAVAEGSRGVEPRGRSLQGADAQSASCRPISRKRSRATPARRAGEDTAHTEAAAVAERTSPSSAEDELEENEAVVVRWGRKQYNAVVIKIERKRPRPVQVQFDADQSLAWVAEEAVRVMADFEPSSLPSWARVGCHVEAIDPHGESGAWHAAIVEEALSGVVDKRDDGVRLWVQYEQSGMCQWLRKSQVRELGSNDGLQPSASTPASVTTRPRGESRGKVRAAAKVSSKKRSGHKSKVFGDEIATLTNTKCSEAGAGQVKLEHVRIGGLSRTSGTPGSEVWLLLDPPPPDVGLDYQIFFGSAIADDAHALASNVVACSVPEDACAGKVHVEVHARPLRQADNNELVHIAPKCSLRFHILDPS